MPSLPDPTPVWEVRRFDIGAGDFHALDVPSPTTRSAWVNRPVAPAIVLGSTQDRALVDPDAASRLGFEIVRRRSGGGAVLVVPGELCWIDLIIGRDDPLWDDDVGRAMHWVGDLWSSALDDLGLPTSVHRGPMMRTAWSDLVCFAGLGPGEVVGEGGAKVVGISQRRTKAWARFQTAALVSWNPRPLVDLLGVDSPAAADVLGRAAQGTGRAAADLEAAVLARLTDRSEWEKK